MPIPRWTFLRPSSCNKDDRVSSHASSRIPKIGDVVWASLKLDQRSCLLTAHVFFRFSQAGAEKAEMKANTFQRLWSTTGANRLFVRVKTTPRRIPRTVRGATLFKLKCSRAKIMALKTMDTVLGRYLAKDGIRKPLKRISSHIGDMHVVQKT